MKRWLATLTLASTLLSGTAWAQEPEKRPANMKLGYAGLAVAMGGASLMVPWGDEYQVVGRTYCVSENARQIERGSCGPALAPKVGAAIVGAGALLAWLGFRSKTVTVTPQVSKSSAGASATVKW